MPASQLGVCRSCISVSIESSNATLCDGSLGLSSLFDSIMTVFDAGELVTVIRLVQGQDDVHTPNCSKSNAGNAQPLYAIRYHV